MRNSFIKIVAILLIVGLNWTGLLAVGQTIAYFNDTEDSPNNIYSAGILDMTVRSGQGNFIPPAENMKPGDSTARDIYIGKTAVSMPLKHRVSFELISGDIELCDQLDLELWYNHYYADKDARLTYDGKLSGLAQYTNTDFIIPHPDDEFDTDPNNGTEQWFYYSISLPNDTTCDFHNKTCEFKFVYQAWQDNINNYEDSGFTDIEEITNTIATGDWSPEVDVLYPDGGETWYLVPDEPGWSTWCLAHGMNANCEYPIEWNATNTIGPDNDLLIDIYFSADSGSTWMAQIADDTENDGIFWWKPPYEQSYITSNGRIKVEAFHKDCPELNNWDMSEEDFCPPMMSLQDLLIWNQTLGRDEVSIAETPQPPAEAPLEEEAATTTEAVATTTEELTTTTEATTTEAVATTTEATTTDAITTVDETATTTEETAMTTDDVIEEANEPTEEPAEEPIDEPVDEVPVDEVPPVEEPAEPAESPADIQAGEEEAPADEPQPDADPPLTEEEDE